MVGRDEALRVADETRPCGVCNRRTLQRVVNYKTRDDVSCYECGTSTTTRYLGKQIIEVIQRLKNRTPEEKKRGRPRKEDE